MVKDKIIAAGPGGLGEAHRAHGRRAWSGGRLGQLGIGNIGAEVFRLAKPFGMKFIAHDPYADPKLAAELGVELVGLEELFRRSRRALGQRARSTTRPITSSTPSAWR